MKQRTIKEKQKYDYLMKRANRLNGERLKELAYKWLDMSNNDAFPAYHRDAYWKAGHDILDAIDEETGE